MSNHKRKQLWETQEPSTAAAEAERPSEEADEVREDGEAMTAIRAELDRLRAELESMRELLQIQAVNEQNARRSVGKLTQKGEETYYSPDEVRAMSHEAVRANYDGIIRSMKHWH